jgi:DNA mismatch endonuclease (patch repair protein)
MSKDHFQLPTDATRRRMVATKQQNNTHEVTLRSELHRRGLRFFVHRRLLSGQRRSTDVVFPTRKLAVYLDGCFWHGCELHGTWPKSNAEWWRQKINANRKRDEDTNRKLANAGWKVLRIWEHETISEAADRVQQALERD